MECIEQRPGQKAQEKGLKHKVHVEVRLDDEGNLDEVVLLVGKRVYCHLEQMTRNRWWLGIGRHDQEFVQVNLTTKQDDIHGHWESDGEVRVEARKA